MPGSELRADLWINEFISPWDYYAHGITRIIAHGKTPFQDMHIVETGAYGKALVLDGKWQSCTGDEFLYHEPLVQIPMLVHGSPRRVLILGGGEGATAREVLRWKTVEHAVMIDIDRQVVDACRNHLPEMHQGAFDDPRLEVVIQDALQYLDKTDQTWDVIISDLSDPIEQGPSFKLFTREYFERARRSLHTDGVFVLQAGPVSPVEMGMHARLVCTMKTVFVNVESFTTYVPTFVSPWGFTLGTAKPINTLPDPAQIDRELADKTVGGFRMLDGRTVLGSFQLPLHLRRAIDEETHIYTLGEPPKFFGRGVSTATPART
ncbi:MAG: fused MFS/spermidine synthase [Phycisphaerae bacterium]|jgi:spermidine synthase